MYSSPDHADRDGAEVAVEHVELRLGDRPPDRHRPVPLRDLRGRRPDGRLGRAVQVPEGLPQGPEPIGQDAGQGLAAAEHRQLGAARPARLEQEPPGRGGGLEERRARVFDRGDQPDPVGGGVAVDQVDPGADRDRQEELEAGDVERQRRDREQRVALADLEDLPHRAEEVHQRPVRDLDALGLARRSRRVDDVSEVCRRDAHAAGFSCARPLRAIVSVGVEADDLRVDAADRVAEPLLGEEHRDPRVLEL